MIYLLFGILYSVYHPDKIQMLSASICVLPYTEGVQRSLCGLKLFNVLHSIQNRYKRRVTQKKKLHKHPQKTCIP
jgi:hypothetical protein